MKKILLTLLLLTACSTSIAQEKAREVFLTTIEYPPYVDSNQIDNGYVAHIVKRSFAEENIDVTILFRPWARGLKGTINGTFTGVFPTFKTKERLKDLLYSDIIDYNILTYIARSEDQGKIERLNGDIKSLRLGLVNGYANTAAIDNNDNLTKDFALDDVNNINKLCRNRVDLIVIDLYVFKSLYKKGRFKDCPKIKPILQPLAYKPFYLTFNKNDEHAKEYREKFNRGLEKVKKQMDRIKKNYQLD
ncbi:transporter substrate-binding domain-containing protein [Halobacteriovorax sp. GB3]|uniref:substrate-binding periplasmic protein n=1 Tax=Halobacteriovorax sp. GB3 TaxID=2719615 RepID=UPI0023601791|nr:transporter substrate-binding domain-containing protein [Halobacteriovorax sp. GB3]MDD0852807.1 transporter substrate-binding domain-containing protein [Halobacteriovorax sp. GB3]